MAFTYPSHYPTQEGFNPYTLPEWAFSWTHPLESKSDNLAEQVRGAGQTIKDEGGLCHAVFACYEASHRLEKTVAILLSNNSEIEKMAALSKLHLQ